MYVRCVSGCLGLFYEGPGTPPPYSDEPAVPLRAHPEGTEWKEEGVPCEGGAANESEEEYPELPF